jgi:hypothetical protein
MVQIIPYEERKNKLCHYCDTWVSVKYKVNTEELDRVYYGMSGHVYCCKKCLNRHYIGKEDICYE